METNTPVKPSRFGSRRAYVGCRTTVERNARGMGIEVFDIGLDGQWTHRLRVAAAANPSYLILSADDRSLHCVHGDGQTISSYAVGQDGSLELIGERSTRGLNPVHLTFSPDARWIVVANYASGSVATLRVQPDGSLGEAAHVLELPNRPGPHRAQQQGSHPHQVCFDPSGRWLLVPDKGADAVHTLGLDSATGVLSLVHTMVTPPGTGPRHLAIDAAAEFAWLVLELSSQVLTCRFDVGTGTLAPIQRLMTVPETFTGHNTGAGIAYLPQLARVCISNRGHGSVASFAVSAASGCLTPLCWSDVGGKMPRFIAALSSTSLCVANEDTDQVVRLDALPNVPPLPLACTGSPVCVAFTQGLP